MSLADWVMHDGSEIARKHGELCVQLEKAVDTADPAEVISAAIALVAYRRESLEIINAKIHAARERGDI